MNRKTLLALAVAGALGSSAASATTFLCETDPADLSYKACAEVSSVSSASMDYLLVPKPAVTTYYVVQPEPALVTYYAIEPAARDLAPADFSTPDLTITSYEYSGSWPETEPSIATYHYYYGFDSAR